MQNGSICYKSIRRCCAVLLLLAGLLLAGCDGTVQSQPARPVPEVAVVTVQPQPVTLTTELPGRTAAFRVAEIRPQVNGLIQRRLFEEGSDVKAGQVLFKIDGAHFRAARDSAVANLAVMKKNTERARAALEASIANVARQLATLELARKNRDRFEDLFKDRAVSASERDKAVTEAEVAKAGLRAAEAQVKNDRRAIAAAEAAIGQAEAALTTARINLQYTVITAPISGRIGRSTVTEGAIVTGYQPAALATIQQLDPMYVDVTQSTAELLRLRHRMGNSPEQQTGASHRKVALILSDGTRYSLEGKLQFRDITVDTTTGSVVIRAVFPNPEGILLPGMFVRAVVEEGVNNGAMLVPQQGVARDVKGIPSVLLVDGAGKVSTRQITVGRAVGDTWLVSSGLAPGDRVIVEGMQKVRPGMTVRVIPFDGDGTPREPSKTPAQQAQNRTDGGA